MLGFSAISESAIASVDDLQPVESLASGFTMDPRPRVMRMADRSRQFLFEIRSRVFGGEPMARCCVDGGSFCKTAAESEFVYFNFTNRLGTRTIAEAGETPDIEAAGNETETEPLTATSVQVLAEDEELEDGSTLEAGKAIAVLIGGGTPGETYAVTVTATLSDGAVIVQEGHITIED